MPASLLEQLETFSSRALRALKLPPTSPHGSPAMEQPPRGVVLHFTADPNFKNVVSWFCDASSRTSAHLVVARGKEEWAAGLDADLPLVAALPCTALQVRQPRQGAWHATWTNPWAWGIEICNSGEVRARAGGPGGGDYVWWPNNWGTVYRQPKPPWPLAGRLWEPYPFGQVQTVATLCRAYNDYAATVAGGGLSPTTLLGHENVQGVATVGCGGHDKRDLGPAFPLHHVRAHVFAKTAAEMRGALVACEAWCNGAGAAAAGQLQLLVNQMGPGASQTNVSLQALSAIAERGVLEKEDNALRKLMLLALAYHVGPGPALRAEDVATLKVFQKMAGLKDDGVAGPKTDAALCARLLDRTQPPRPVRLPALA